MNSNVERPARLKGVRHALARHVLLAASALTGAACGAQTPVVAPVTATPTPQEVTNLAVLLVPSTIVEVNAAAQAALVQAGYTIVVDPRAAHDAVGKLAASAVEVPSMFQLQVNDHSQAKHRVSVSLTIEASGRIIDQVSTQFETSNGHVTPDQLSGLVSALNASSGVKRFAGERAAAKQRADDAVAQKQADRAAADKERADSVAAQRQAADADWERVVGECREPKSLTSCDSLRAWVDKNSPRRRNGVDSTVSYQDAQLQKKRDDARKILDSAALALKGFAEADSWAHVDLGRCAAATTRDDCTSASQYLARFPGGAHVDEAKKALEAADKKLTAQEEQAQRQADAQQAAAAHQQQQANCKAACSTTTCVMFTTDDKKSKCVAQCVQGCN